MTLCYINMDFISSSILLQHTLLLNKLKPFRIQTKVEIYAGNVVHFSLETLVT